MISIYSAPNTLEAHMVLDLLEQAGIKGTIKNEHLQGIERIDSGGFIKVYVEKSDFENASKIIADMKTSQPEPEKTTTLPTVQNNPLKYFIIGVIGGATAVALYFYTPYIVTKIDNNQDGKTDGKQISFNYRLSRSEYDRNFDGKVDVIYKYNRENEFRSANSDDDFDGIFETYIEFLHGNIIWSESDTTGDGFKDYRNEYKDGILIKAIFYNPITKQPVKIQNYQGQKIISAQIDTNGDGRLNQRVEYNSIEEPVK